MCSALLVGDSLEQDVRDRSYTKPPIWEYGATYSSVS